MKNIIITGGCGFIGFNLVANLMKHYNILIIDNFNDFYNPSIKIENNLFYVKEDDINLHRIETPIFIHLAAEPGVRESIGKVEVYIHQNVDGTKCALNLAKEIKSELFINFSSSTVYGNYSNIPVHESMKKSPISPYGVSKAKAEEVCNDFISTSSFPIITFRPFSVYGAQQRPNMVISQFLNEIENHKSFFVYGDGEQMRDFTFVGDLVKIVKKTLEIDFSLEHHIFNIGYGNPITINELIQKLSSILNFEPEFHRSHRLFRCCR